ncbi:hypothetical protein [Sphaerisporangium rufum]|nr:hypothetical protein [Sphaerisporangium rufum]
MREYIDVDATSLARTGARFQGAEADYGRYVAELRERLDGAGFPWPDQEATTAASLYAQIMAHLLGRGAGLADRLGDVGARYTAVGRAVTATEEAAAAEARRAGQDIV